LTIPIPLSLALTIQGKWIVAFERAKKWDPGGALRYHSIHAVKAKKNTMYTNKLLSGLSDLTIGLRQMQHILDDMRDLSDRRCGDGCRRTSDGCSFDEGG
jgi:hypothetical protein